MALGTHEFQSIDEIYINEDELTLGSADSDGIQQPTAPSQYVGDTDKGRPIMRLETKLGTSSDSSFSTLSAITNGLWTDAHRLTNIPAILGIFAYDNEAFPNGIPNISAVVKGKKY